MSIPTSTGAAGKTATAAPVPLETRKIAYLLVFFAVCYLAFLGRFPLIDPDEPVYAETGKLMALGHGFAAWWTPHYNGQLWFDKPPLTYWLVGLCMKVFGISEFSARLPVALAALGLVWMTALLTRRIYPQSRAAPVWAALAIGSCGQSLILAHACVTDMLFALTLTGALLGVWDWLSANRWTPILWAGVAIGLAVMVKGPVAIVLIGALLLIYAAASKQAGRFFSAPIWLSLLLALAISGPWYVSMVLLHGQSFAHSFLEAQNVTRYLAAEHSATAFPLFFVPALLAGFLPWTFALIPALLTSFQRACSGEAGDRFALIWIATVFLFFSASQSKLVTYIYPLYPLAAGVTGFWIAERMQERSAVWLGACQAIVVAAAAILLLGHAWLDAKIGYVGGIVVLPYVLAILTLPVHRSGARGRVPPGCSWLRFSGAQFMAFPAIALAILIPVLAAGPIWKHPDPESLSAIDIARAVAANSKAGDTVYALTFNKPSLVYYSDRVITFTDNQQMVGPALSRPPFPICVTKPDILTGLNLKRLLGRYRILAQTGNQVVLIRCEAPVRGA